MDRPLFGDEGMMRQVLDTMLAFVGLFTPTGTIVEVNRHTLDISGLTRAAIIGKPFGESFLFAHSDEEQARARSAVLRAGAGETVRDDFRVQLASGRFRIIDGIFSPLRNDNGEIAFVVGWGLDVTDRRELEVQLQQSQKMETIGRLAGGVAHDFNNLLTVIAGNAELLRLSATPESEQEVVDEIVQACERGAALTRQLLAFSRQQVLAAKILNVNTVIADTESLLRRLVGEDIELTAVLDSAVRPVRIDPGHLMQILMNMSVNARDAMPVGGRLTIETRDVQLDPSYVAARPGIAPGRYALMAISDTGTGMTRDIVSRIFDPFFTTKGVGKGTGLGLAVVHGIVEQGGGRIDVDSEPGKGTTFRIYLPVTEQTQQPAAAAPPEPAPSVKGTILLVEDDDQVRRLTARGLQQHGFTVIQARNGIEALRDFRMDDIKPDLLITDVVMPGINGRELAAALRRQASDLRVIYISGYTDDALVRSGIRQNEVVFVQKPYTLGDIISHIRTPPRP
jgi:PAS domain S-box-containing protein